MLKFKGTIIIFVIVIALLTYVLLVEVKQPTKEEKEEEEKIVFQIEDTDTVKSIKFTLDGNEIVCAKEETGWYITEPVQARGDEGIFNGILANLAELKAEQKLEELDGDLGDYGLEEPFCTVEVIFDTGESDVIVVGNKTFDDNAYYAQTGKDKMLVSLASYVVDGYFIKQLDGLRDKSIISFDTESVKEFDFQHEGNIIKCEKNAQNMWNMIEPVEDRADMDNITFWLNSINNFRASTFLSNQEEVDLDVYGLDEPFIGINIIVDEDKGKKSLFIGNKDETQANYYSKRGDDPEIFLLNAASVDNLYSKPIEEWVDTSVFDLPFGEVISFEMKQGDTIVSGKKDDEGNWMFLQPEEKKALSWQIENQITNVINVKANMPVPSLRELVAFGLDKPYMVIKLTNDTGENATLLIGEESEETVDVYAKREDSDQIFLLNKTLVDSLSSIINNPPYEGEE